MKIAILDRLAMRDREHGALGRHSVMLISLVFMLIAMPILGTGPSGEMRFPFLLCLVLVAAIHVNRTQRWVLWLAILLGGGAAIGMAVANATGLQGARIAGASLGLVLLGITTFVMLNTLVQTRQVEVDTVVGGICIYLLFGICFTVLYRLLIEIDPEALVLGGVALEAAPGDESSLYARLIYFSFVTLTTVGFGDIAPHSEAAQMLAACEAVIGQLYLAIFIARLMGLYMAHSGTRAMGDRSDTLALRPSQDSKEKTHGDQV